LRIKEQETRLTLQEHDDDDDDDVSKNTHIKFHDNPSNGSRVLDGRTDSHDEAVSRFSQFYEKRLKKDNRVFI